MVMADVTNYANAIEAMRREDFRDNILNIIAKREDFSRLVCLGIDALTSDEKFALRTAMASYGIPLEVTDTDMALNAVAYNITARAVSLA